MISIVIIRKDEPSLDATLRLVALQANAHVEPSEIVVVDASEGRLGDIRDRHPGVRWLDYVRPAGIRVSIPHQRNVGVSNARGDLVVFTDAGCLPLPQWLRSLVTPILSEQEDVTSGVVTSPGQGRALYDSYGTDVARYLPECPTLNMAFRKTAFQTVGGFDETFEYGSDVDFTWRLVDAGFRIRAVPEAVVAHDWGDARRQAQRAFAYGKARTRLYRKAEHRYRLRYVWSTERVGVVYAAFLIGLPVTFFFPFYPALLAIPIWRNRRDGAGRLIAEHLLFGLGVLAEFTRRRTLPSSPGSSTESATGTPPAQR